MAYEDDGSDYSSHLSMACHTALARRRKPRSPRVLPKEVMRQAAPVKLEVVITTKTPQSSPRFHHLKETRDIRMFGAPDKVVRESTKMPLDLSNGT